MKVKQEEEDIKKATASTPTVPRPPSPTTKHAIGEAMGWLMYFIAAQQFLHVCIFATNSTFMLPSFLSSIFSYHIDPLMMNATLRDAPTRMNVRTDELKTEMKRTMEAGTWGYSIDALGMDMLLLAAIAIHHSLMARLPWQRALTSFMPRWGERVSYLLASVFFFQLLFRHWIPLPQTMWTIENTFGMFMMRMGCALGFVWVIASVITAALDDKFGFRQAFTGTPTQGVPLQVHSVYKLSRMPLFFGVLLCLWSASTMTLGRLLFAVFFTMYTVVGGYLQDKDMRQKYGRQYEAYQQRVPFLIPFVSYH